MANNLAILPSYHEIETAVSQIPHLHYLTTARKDLVYIIDIVQASNRSSSALNDLVHDTLDTVVLLLTWARDVRSLGSSDIKNSVEELVSNLRLAIEFIKQQLSSHHRVLNFVWLPRYKEKIGEKQFRLKIAKERFTLLSQMQVGVGLSHSIRITDVQDEIFMQVKRSIEKQQVLDKLRGSYAVIASHAAFEQRGVNECFGSTRTTVINDILNWFNEPENPCRMLWLHGPVGSGKTAVAQTIANILADQGRLGASFFWSAAVTNGTTPREQFVVTIAYQLCINIPGFSECVASALEKDINVLSTNQLMEQLVVLPLQNLHQNKVPSSTEPPWLLLIDGIDESDDPAFQEEIMQQLVILLNHVHFPLLLFFGSRNDYVINNAQTFFRYVQPNMLSLFDDPYLEKDIRTWLEFRFSRIKEEHAGWAPCLTDGPIQEHLYNWPTSDAVDALVNKSAGLYVYADAAMNYIEDAFNHPVDRLQDVLGKGIHPFENLDRLYAAVLRKIPAHLSNDIQAVLNWIICGKEDVKTKTVCDRLFGFDPQYSTILLSYLASVVHTSSSGCDIVESESLRILHKSFSEFLQDRPRLQCYRLDLFHCDAIDASSELGVRPALTK